MSSRAVERALRALAREYGVQRRYRGADQADHVVSDGTLCAVLQVLGAELSAMDDAPDALRAFEVERARRIVAPVLVQWDDETLAFDVNVGSDAGDRRVTAHVQPTDDERSPVAVVLEANAGATPGTRRVSFAEPLPYGIYELQVEAGSGSGAESREATSVVIAAPSRLARSARRWGVFAPTYALHDRDRASTGTLASLDRFAGWAGTFGASVVGTLPLLATFFGAGREPNDPSPYAPVSRRHWNEVYLDLHAVPDIDAGVSFTEPSPGEFVDLPALAARKRAVLEGGLSRLDASGARTDAFVRFLKARPDVIAYATFRAAVELGGPGATVSVEPDHPVARYHAYAQWLVEGQLDALAQGLRARDQELYLDLPIGSHGDGFDVASHESLFARGAAVGAPPDSFFRDGQNWGFPPVHPHASRADGHAYVRACFDAHFRIARWVRVDHVLGFHRLWWVPDGASAADGAYVNYPAEELYALLALAAHRQNAHVVGENLGTVPPQTNRALRRHGMLGMYVVPFEADAERDPPLSPPSPRSLACLDTHDTATFAVWWRDLAPDEAKAIVAWLQQAGALAGADASDGVPDAQSVFRALLEYLGASRAEAVLVNVEDLWLETVPQNVPGTTNDERPNFRRRLARSLDDLDALALDEHAPEHAALLQLDRTRRPRGGHA